jgi:pre-mRNA-splicing factor ATP-dependent RNA helicase DHX38/PRP16
MSDPSRDRKDDASSTGSKNDPHRLTSLLPSAGRGGLMKPPPSAATAANSQPRASLLGLDRLAASKRNDNASGSAAGNSSKPARQYRRSNETPVAPSQQHQQHPVDVRRQQRRDHPYQPAADRRRGGQHGRNNNYGGDNNNSGSSSVRRDNDYESHERDNRRDRPGADYDSYERRDNRRDRPGGDNSSTSSSSYRGRRERDAHDVPATSSRQGPNRSSRRDDPDDSYRRPRDNYSQLSSRRDDGDDNRRQSQSQVTPSTVNTNNTGNSNYSSSRNDGSQFRSYRQQDRGGDVGSSRGRRLEDAPTPGRQSSYQQQQQQQRMPSSQLRGRNNNSNNDAWEVETPAPLQRDDVDGALMEPADEDFDRDFYLQEDEGHAVQDATDDNDLGRFLYTNAKIEARQQAMEKQKEGSTNQRVTARQSALNHDQQAWEENRLLSAGAAVQGTVDLDHATEQDTSVTLLVHQVKPPFLDGRVSFSTIREAVPTVRDASSDFAKMAREGSETLRHLRANKDKNAMRQKFWELGGTRMGDAVGIKEGDGTDDKNGKDKDRNDDGPAAETADGEIDYKKSTGFKDHVKNKEGDGPVSHFAKSKTIRQQREFLPIFGVREELLNIIRENNVVIIVGETGSGTRNDL